VFRLKKGNGWEELLERMAARPKVTGRCEKRGKSLIGTIHCRGMGVNSHANTLKNFIREETKK